jgi:ubiquinone/menaquinone biosynthesis C-methylase UbiE
MMESSSTSHYALGSTEAEHDRLIRQAVRLTPCTERLFREAGIDSGQRVLDLGSGVGDVAMLAARLVGSSGEVMGIERDSRSVARARTRVAEAGVHYVSFWECDVSQVQIALPFDAAVGRFILEVVSDPVSILRRLSQVVRPGGVLVFQEVSYAPLVALSAQLPLWSKALSLVQETLQRSGANTEVGIALHRIFREAGLPAPTMRMEVMLGIDSDFTQWIYSLLCSLRPQIEQHNLSLEPLGDFDTLPERIQSEVEASKSVVPFVALVGAWARRPETKLPYKTRSGR